MWPNPQFSVDLATFTDKIVNRKLHFLCSKDDIRHDASRSIQGLCSYFIPVSLTLSESPGLWDKFDLDAILLNGYHLLKPFGKFRYLGMKDQSSWWKITGEIPAMECSLSFSDIKIVLGKLGMVLCLLLRIIFWA